MSGDAGTPNGAPARAAVREPPDTAPRGGSVAASDPSAEREARRVAREQRRGPSAERPEQRARSPRARPRPQAPGMRGAAIAGIVAIAVALAAIMASQGAQGWLIGLAASVTSLLLAAALRRSRGS